VYIEKKVPGGKITSYEGENRGRYPEIFDPIQKLRGDSAFAHKISIGRSIRERPFRI
jgi:hypothetical protein